MTESPLIPIERVEQAIYLIRGQKVMLDRDLAALYGVETKVLNQAVKRNIKRFPSDFMFELTREEIRNMSQFVTCSEDAVIKHSKRVSVFTEQGVAMLLAELESKYDEQFRMVFDAIRELMIPPEPKKNPIGFHVREEPAIYKVRKISESSLKEQY